MAAADARRLHPSVRGEVGGAERQPLHARRGAADLLHVRHAPRGLEDRVHEDRPVEAGLRLELGEQPVDVVDVLRPLDLGDHDDVEPVAGFEHGGGQVVETPRRVEAVDARPELRVAEVDLRGDLDETGARGVLLIGRHTVFEVGEQDVDRRCDVGHLRPHLLVGRREEVDHPARPERDLADGLGGPDGERSEEVLGRAHRPQPYETRPNRPKVTTRHRAARVVWARFRSADERNRARDRRVERRHSVRSSTRRPRFVA